MQGGAVATPSPRRGGEITLKWCARESFSSSVDLGFCLSKERSKFKNGFGWNSTANVGFMGIFGDV